MAALAVVAHHAAQSVNAFVEPIPTAIAAVVERGYLGVDFFFVLSGFIIYWTTEGKTPRSYSISRARRIYVPYLPIGIAMAVLYTILPTSRPWGWLSTITLFPVQPGPALSVAWTLQHEILFYALFGLLFFTGRLKEGLALWAILIAIAWLAGIRDVIPLAPINLEFLFGILAGVAVKRGIRISPWFAPFPFALWLFLGARPEHSVLIGLSLAFIIAALAEADLRGLVRTSEPMLFLGAASYSIYLIHNPVISVLGRLADPLAWWAALPILFCAAAACGCLYHWLYERPAIKLTLRRPVPVQAPSAN